MPNSAPQQKRIEIFVEGISELIYVRHILEKIYNYNSTVLYIHCSSLNPYTNLADLRGCGNPDARYHIEITDVGSYTKLLSTIINRASGLIKNSTTKVLGLRDIGCKEFTVHNKTHTTDQSIQYIEEAVTNAIATLGSRIPINIYYAVMELEAWFLAFPSSIAQIHTTLTNTYIQTNLGLDLATCDPEKQIINQSPSDIYSSILALVGNHDDKPRRTYVFVSFLTLESIDNIREIKVERLHRFVDALRALD